MFKEIFSIYVCALLFVHYFDSNSAHANDGDEEKKPRYIEIVDKPRLWDEYKKEFKRKYKQENPKINNLNPSSSLSSNTPNTLSEHDLHRDVFFKNVDKILSHNILRGNRTFSMALNKFADILPPRQGLNHRLFSRKKNEHIEDNMHMPLFQVFNLSALVQFPQNFDWREHGVVSRVRDQGECGSCWAITIAGALEGIFYWINRKTVHFSEQELIDCSTKDYGCEGGWFETALDYISQKKSQRWLSEYNQYPYKGRQMQCAHVTSDLASYGKIIEIVGRSRLPENKEDMLKEALVTRGPIPIAIEVPNSLYLYSNGIFQNYDPTASAGSAANLNHAVLLMGYGVDEATHLPYWTIKNSWGEDWGESGYFRILRGRNECGIGAYSVVPIFSLKNH